MGPQNTREVQEMAVKHRDVEVMTMDELAEHLIGIAKGVMNLY